MQIQTKYTEIAEAAQENNVAFDKVFMNVEEAAEGTNILKYPITELSENGELIGIDANGDGTVDHPEWSNDRINSAEKLAEQHGHEKVIENMESMGIVL